MESTLLTRPEKKFFSTSELVTFLHDYAGMTVTKGTVFKWSMMGKIPCQKAPNGRLLFPVDKVQQWVESGNVEQGEGAK